MKSFSIRAFIVDGTGAVLSEPDKAGNLQLPVATLRRTGYVTIQNLNIEAHTLIPIYSGFDENSDWVTTCMLTTAPSGKFAGAYIDHERLAAPCNEYMARLYAALQVMHSTMREQGW